MPVRLPISLLCTILLLLASFSLAAQERSRLGFVDMKRVLDTAPQVLASRERLELEFRPRSEAVLEDEQRLVDLEQQLLTDTALSEESRANLDREVRNLTRAIERRKEDLGEEIRFRFNEIANSLESVVDIIIDEIATDQGYDLILASGAAVVYHSERIDITDLVLERLQDEFDADQAELAGN